MKEIREDTNRKNVPCSQIGIINIVKISRVPKAIYRLKAIPVNISMAYSQNQNNSKIGMGPRNTLNSRNNLEKEQNWRYHAP